MRTIRLYTPGPLVEGTEIALTPEGANHIARVLRGKIGDPLHVFDGSGGEFSATISAIASKSVKVGVDRRVASVPESALRITLVQGISRGEKMDWVVQKATELGVAAIVPVITSRSVVKLDRNQAAKKQDHWQTIAINACEQCGRAVIPTVSSPAPLPDFLGKGIGDSPQFRFVLDPQADSSLPAAASKGIGEWPQFELLIGPEGGLDEAEIEAAVAAGFTRVGLGPRVLRTETAAVVALAVLQGNFGDLR